MSGTTTETGLLGLSDFTVQGASTAGPAGKQMLANVGTTSAWIADLLSGPVFWVVIAAGIVYFIAKIARHGGSQGSDNGGWSITVRAMGFMLLAAVLKALSGLLRTGVTS